MMNQHPRSKEYDSNFPLHQTGQFRHTFEANIGLVAMANRRIRMDDWFPELRGADNAHSVDFCVVAPRGQWNMAAHQELIPATLCSVTSFSEREDASKIERAIEPPACLREPALP